MRNLIIALAVLAMAIPAFAGQNPNLSVFLDGDMATPGSQNEVYPTASSLFSVYICFTDFGEGGGMTGCSLQIPDFAGAMFLSTTNMMGGLVIGTPNDGLSLSGDCTLPDADGVVVAANLSYLYLGIPGEFVILPDPGQGAVATDCNVELDTWCVCSTIRNGFIGNMGVGMAPMTDGDCQPISPVEESSWGGIKALYR